MKKLCTDCRFFALRDIGTPFKLETCMHEKSRWVDVVTGKEKMRDPFDGRYGWKGRLTMKDSSGWCGLSAKCFRPKESK